MTNTSATGGYLAPTASALPGDLTLVQFIQTVIVGITGLDGALVRPRWQTNPPVQPAVDVNWCAFGIVNEQADANAYVQPSNDLNGSKVIRHEQFDVQCSFYGPLAPENAAILRDGFQISQNREAMFLANMSFKDAGAILPADELVNDRWFRRKDITITLVRQIQPLYQILPIVSVLGLIRSQSLSLLSVPFDSNDATSGGFSNGYDQEQFG